MDFDNQIHAVDYRTGIAGRESVASSSATVTPVPVVSVAEAAAGSAGLHSEIGILMCRCAMIHEDSLEAFDNDADDADVTTINQSHSDSELAAEESPSGQPNSDHSFFGNTLEVPTSIHSGSVVGSRPLVSVRSSPQLLNEICEETETADDEDAPSSASAAIVQTHISRRTSAEQSRHLDRLHRVHRRKMNTMVPRVASCSSSDASDTDEIVDQNGRKQRKQKPAAAAPANIKYLGRRDSSEHSSDNDSQPCGAASYPGTGNIASGISGSTARRSSDSQCGNRQGQSRDTGRTKRAESEHSYQRHGLNSCRTASHCNSSVIADWKSLDTRFTLQLFSDCYSEEAEDSFCDYSPEPDKDWIMNSSNKLSNLIWLHSKESSCLSNAFDLSFINGLMKWCNDGSLQHGRHSTANLGAYSNSVAVLTGMGCSGSYDSRLRARKVSL